MFNFHYNFHLFFVKSNSTDGTQAETQVAEEFFLIIFPADLLFKSHLIDRISAD